MDDVQLLHMLQKSEPGALSAAIEKYTAYVSTVISNQLGLKGGREDIEELTANVFVSLWENRNTIHTGKLRGWLGTVARNEARSFLRKKRLLTVSPEDVILVSGDVAQKLLEKDEARRLLQQALDSLGQPDKEVFLRFYYYDQSIPDIAREMRLNREAVKSKLRRGRTKLKDKLTEGGYAYGTEH